MAASSYDVLGIGNAIVDVIARTEDDFLVREGLVKASMKLIEADEAERLYDAMGTTIQTSGGSAGNTIAGIGSFGGKAIFVGKVADDPLGDIYRHDMKALGVRFDTSALSRQTKPTARCMIFVTPDGERTMNTYLGACQDLGPEDIDADQIASAGITYMEGYLYDPPRAKEAFHKAAKIAHDAGRKVSLTLSDSFCVDRYRDEFLGLLRDNTVDILFANDGELKSLYQTASLDAAVTALQQDCRLAAVTLGADGCYVVTPENVEQVSAQTVERVVDTTGAGDLFAAGFLFGVARGLPHRTAAELGCLAAAEAISHMGPRPEVSLSDLARQHGHHV